MNRADDVFALFVDANPVPDPETVAGRPRLELLPTPEGSIDMQTQERTTPTDPTPAQQRTSRWAVSREVSP